jgi:hypothetical protein
MTLCYQSSDMTKFDYNSDLNVKSSDNMSGYFLFFGDAIKSDTISPKVIYDI